MLVIPQHDVNSGHEAGPLLVGDEEDAGVEAGANPRLNFLLRDGTLIFEFSSNIERKWIRLIILCNHDEIRYVSSFLIYISDD